MEYNKETGDVTIWDPEDEVVEQKKILNNVDEVFEHKRKLYEELGLDEEGLPKEDTNPENFDIKKLAGKMKKLRTDFMDEFEYDPSMFY